MIKLHTRILILLLLTCSNLFGQSKPFKVDKTKDDAWIEQLIKAQNQENSSSQKRNEFEDAVFTKGKVFYSADKSMRVAQISGSYKDNNYYVTTLQFKFGTKQLEKKLTGVSNILNHHIEHVFRLPGKSFSYLILSKELEKSDNLGNEDLGKTDFYGATFHCCKDSIYSVNFLSDPSDIDLEQTYGITKSTFSMDSDLEITSLPQKQNYRCPTPYLRYDTLTNSLRYLFLYFPNDEDAAYYGVFSGCFNYHDSTFIKAKDSNWYFPPLSASSDTLSVSKLKVGHYDIKTFVVNKYENSNGGPHLYMESFHDINGKIFKSFSQDADSLVIADTTLFCRLQKDSSLIMETFGEYTGNNHGECAACQHKSYTFDSFRKNESKKIFNCSFNLGTGANNYEYSDNEGKEHKGKFYCSADTAGSSVTADISWENDYTVLAKVYDSGNDTQYREFRINFKAANGKTSAEMVIGQDIKTKPDTSK